MDLSYTKRISDSLYEQWIKFDNADEDYSEFLNYINSPETFRPFGEGLLFWLQKKNPAITEETMSKYIEECCNNKGINKKEIASDGTIRNWIKKDMRPDKSEDSRESIFAFAFALGLTPEDTAEVFHKVYLDRAFDYRNEKEVIYYFCLNKSKSWADATRLIEQVSLQNAEQADRTVYTAHIKRDIDEIKDEAALITYIKEHGNNFAKRNIAAKRNVNYLQLEAKRTAQIEADFPEHDGQFMGSNRESDSFLYEMITNISVSGGKGTKTLFNKNSRFPKEIRNRFPEAGTLSKKERTYEELRKLLILLFAYQFWFKAQTAGMDNCIDDFVAEIDAYLIDSGMSPIYPGNPYDWLFLYCSLNERPLDTFRGIIADVLPADKQ